MLPDPSTYLVGRTRRHYRNRQETDADDPSANNHLAAGPASGSNAEAASAAVSILVCPLPCRVAWPTGSFTGVRWFVKSSVDPSVMGLVHARFIGRAKKHPHHLRLQPGVLTGRRCADPIARGRLSHGQDVLMGASHLLEPTATLSVLKLN